MLFEKSGAIFLPASGYRSETDIVNANPTSFVNRGGYWSATKSSYSKAYLLFFRSGAFGMSEENLHIGKFVHLVKDL